MSLSSGQTPVYIVKWALRRNERGRKHMAIFIPNPQHKDINPSDESKKCLGTLLQVQGSPLMGFEHNIKRNWDRQGTDNVESVHFLSLVDSQYAPVPPTSEIVRAETRTIDQVALTVRPPGVSQPLWDADSIFDCQDWVFDCMTYLSQKRVVDADALNTLRTLQDTKTALMAQPGSSSAPAQLITASTVRVAPSAVGQPFVSAPTSRGIYSNSEWDAERRAFRRYDQTAQQWEYRDNAGVWKPQAQG